MRIALITDGIYPFVIGGMQKHSYYLCKYLSLHFKIDLYHFRRQNFDLQLKDVFPETFANINEFEVEFKDRYKIPFHYLLASRNHSKKVFSLWSTNDKVDLIICKGFTSWSFLFRKTKLPSTPTLLNFHGYEMYQHAFTLREKIIQKVFQYFSGNLSRKADYCFSYGGKITHLMKDKIGITSTQILEFPSAIEASQVRSVSEINVNEKIRFCFMGRYERRKGIEELNTAITHLPISNRWSFDFIGEIPEYLRLDSLHINYHGLLKNSSDINKVLDNCDVLVCPSWSEGMPNVILEAMGRGLAIAATDCGATSLLVTNETGWIIENNSAANVKSVLNKIIESDMSHILQKKRAAIMHISDNFIWEKISDKLCQKLVEIHSSKR